MTKLVALALLFYCCALNQLFAQQKDSLYLGKFITSINVGNAIILRPQLSFEYRLSDLNSAEVTLGYIAQNKSLQKNTVRFLNEDAFLSSGFHFGLGYKRMSVINPNGYYGLQTYFKTHNYKNKIWDNGIPESDDEAMAYLMSNSKRQFGAYMVIGKYAKLGPYFILNSFVGFGVLTYTYTKTYHEKIYDNSLRFIDKVAPFTEAQNKLYPIVHGGVKLGFHK